MWVAMLITHFIGQRCARVQRSAALTYGYTWLRLVALGEAVFSFGTVTTIPPTVTTIPPDRDDNSPDRDDNSPRLSYT